MIFFSDIQYCITLHQMYRVSPLSSQKIGIENFLGHKNWLNCYSWNKQRGSGIPFSYWCSALRKVSSFDHSDSPDRTVWQFPISYERYSEYFSKTGGVRLFIIFFTHNLNDVFQVLGSRGPNSQATASMVDQKSGVLFYTQVNKNGVGCWNPASGDYSADTNGLIATDNVTMVFPNDLKVSITINLLNLSF